MKRIVEELQFKIWWWRVKRRRRKIFRTYITQMARLGHVGRIWL